MLSRCRSDWTEINYNQSIAFDIVIQVSIHDVVLQVSQDVYSLVFRFPVFHCFVFQCFYAEISNSVENGWRLALNPSLVNCDYCHLTLRHRVEFGNSHNRCLPISDTILSPCLSPL